MGLQAESFKTSMALAESDLRGAEKQVAEISASMMALRSTMENLYAKVGCGGVLCIVCCVQCAGSGGESGHCGAEEHRAGPVRQGLGCTCTQRDGMRYRGMDIREVGRHRVASARLPSPLRLASYRLTAP